VFSVDVIKGNYAFHFDTSVRYLKEKYIPLYTMLKPTVGKNNLIWSSFQIDHIITIHNWG